MAGLLGVSAPTLIYWESNFEGEVPERFLGELSNIVNTIESISERTSVPSKKIIPILLEFKKSPFWKGWPEFKNLMTSSIGTETNVKMVHDGIDGHILHLPGQLKAFKALSSKIGSLEDKLHLAYKDKSGDLLGVFIFPIPISLPTILKEFEAIEKIRTILPSAHFHIYAKKIENSVRFGLADLNYIKLFEYDEKMEVLIKEIKK